MQFPVRPEDVKIVQGNSGKGLQVQCSCGAINWNHVEVLTSLWPCRNCGRVLSNYFPGLVEGALALHKQEAAPQAQPTTT